jgi:ubiquinone biosynthesis protein COQ9
MPGGQDYSGDMTQIADAASESAPKTAPKTDWAVCMEQAVLDAAIERAPSLGWNSRLVRAACEANGLSLGDEELLLPNGARDLAVLMSPPRFACPEGIGGHAG